MQAIHRHVPILIRALGPSYIELLKIISDPPKGSENLLTQVCILSLIFPLFSLQLQVNLLLCWFIMLLNCSVFYKVLHVLCEGTTPSDHLVATVKRLYETKLKVKILKISWKRCTCKTCFLWYCVYMLILSCRMLQYLFQYYLPLLRTRFPSLYFNMCIGCKVKKS